MNQCFTSTEQRNQENREIMHSNNIRHKLFNRGHFTQTNSFQRCCLAYFRTVICVLLDFSWVRLMVWRRSSKVSWSPDPQKVQWSRFDSLFLMTDRFCPGLHEGTSSENVKLFAYSLSQRSDVYLFHHHCWGTQPLQTPPLIPCQETSLLQNDLISEEMFLWALFMYSLIYF